MFDDVSWISEITPTNYDDQCLLLKEIDIHDNTTLYFDGLLYFKDKHTSFF